MTTGLLGRKPRKILGEFQVNGTGTQITGCPAGNKPKSSSYIKKQIPYELRSTDTSVKDAHTKTNAILQ